MSFRRLDSLPSRPNWKFFHPPFHAGHIHGIAIHPERPERIFAGVEHGSLIYTHDSGENWHETLTGHDLHRVVVDPVDPDRLFAGDGSGLLASSDAGATWKMNADLRGKYIHGIRFDPANPDRVYVYADAANSPLYGSDDAGETWQPIGAGLPAAAPSDNLCLHPTTPDKLFYAGDRGRGSVLYASSDAGESWRTLDLELPKVWRMHAAG